MTILETVLSVLLGALIAIAIRYRWLYREEQIEHARNRIYDACSRHTECHNGPFESCMNWRCRRAQRLEIRRWKRLYPYYAYTPPPYSQKRIKEVTP